MTVDAPDKYENILASALKLTPDERIAMIEALAASFRTQTEANLSTQNTWTPKEIEEMMHVSPLPGAEIIAQGLTGSWQDLDIEDSVTWLDARKRQRKERKKW